MPKLIEHIDAIARKKQCAVLFIEFHPEKWGDYANEMEDGECDDSWRDYEYRVDQRREKVLAWLDENVISWQECGPVANEQGFRSYLGEIYIDVPYDENNPQYRLVRDYLENPDGTMRDESIRFYCLPLEVAMKNAHHDEPGFWEKWAEKF